MLFQFQKCYDMLRGDNMICLLPLRKICLLTFASPPHNDAYEPTDSWEHRDPPSPIAIRGANQTAAPGASEPTNPPTTSPTRFVSARVTSRRQL